MVPRGCHRISTPDLIFPSLLFLVRLCAGDFLAVPVCCTELMSSVSMENILCLKPSL